MKKLMVFKLGIVISLLSLYPQASAPPAFDDYFIDCTMRIDYYHTGDKKQEFFSLDRIYRQGQWAGPRENLVDPFDNGRYYFKIYHLDSGKLIFSKGYNSYFGEYKTTAPAAKGIKRTYHETALIPFPREKIRFTIEARDRRNRLGTVFETPIDPASMAIARESLVQGVKVYNLEKNGPPHQKVDLAFVAEGYTPAEESKVAADFKRAVGVFFQAEPFRTHRKNFNVYGVFKPSQESGCDEPTQRTYKNTAVGASFNALGLKRYLLTEDNKSLRDVSAYVPYDALIIMVNHDRYGGGGIYNTYTVFTADSQAGAYLLLHEFGHSFAGLGDEYYASNVSYTEFYPPGIEPTEPNITALLDPKNLKWKALVTPGTAIPTDWEKESFDQMPSQDKKKHLEKEGWQQVVGAFEGAGYSSTGLYRPMINCIMFSRTRDSFCRVCEAAVVRMIEHYTR